MGALGPVFRTYEPTRDRLVAVKVFRLDVTPEQAQALADELARAAEAELIHPSIVEPIAAGVEGTVAYRAEEYVAAESLDAAMRHYAPADFDTMLRIVGQLAEAVDAARAAGVGHGALHPRDIFITPDEARASGFGVVDALERVGLRAPVRRPYSAPERIAGAAWSTPADVFSLAAIAFELLTGRRPSGTGADIGPLSGATVAGAERLQAVLARAMAEDPADRFATGLELADALAAAGAAVHVAPPTFAEEDEDVDPETVEPEAAPLGESGASIRMIALPAEPPVFADERSARRAATTPSLFVDVPYERQPAATPVDDVPEQVEAHDAEPADIVSERDEDEAHFALTRDEDAALASGTIEARDLHAAEYAPDDVEAAADALVFDAANLTLREGAAPVDDFHRFSRAEREAAVTLPSVEPEHEFREDPPLEPPAALPPVRLDRLDSAPQQVIEREVPPPLSNDPDERVLFEHLGGAAERPRTAVLPLALMLLVGLLIGFGGGYVVRGRQPGAPVTPVADAPAPATTAPPAAIESTGGAAGSGATTTGRATSERPAAPAAAAAPRPAGAVRSGTLIVRSTPSGAGVTINGKWSGRTPLTERSLPFGDYTVRATLPGFQSKPEEVTLSADAASRTLSLQLQKETPRPAPPAAASRPTPAPGSAPASRPAAETPGTGPGVLEIDSRPTGARVFVDDRAVGATPVRLPDVTPGSHVVRLELPDHQVWTERAQVTAGKTTRVAGSLEPIR